MKRNTYFPIRIADQIIWLLNFCNKLPGYATPLGLASVQVTAAVADGCWLAYVLQNWLPAARAWALACTDSAIEAQTGTGAVAMTLPVFALPTLPAGVVSVKPGALDRIFLLVLAIKDSGKCTETIGSDLGVFGTEKTGPDLTTLQPVFKIRVSAGNVSVDWNWGGNREFLDLIEIQVDRGGGAGFVPLTFDTTPGYNDTTSHPAAPIKWTYKAIYRVGDGQVGLWSNPVSVIVGG